MLGAAYCPIEGKVNPLTAAPAFAAAAGRKLGATDKLWHCQRTRYPGSRPNGFPGGYQQQGYIRSGTRLVNAAGVGSVSIAAMLGVTLGHSVIPDSAGGDRAAGTTGQTPAVFGWRNADTKTNPRWYGADRRRMAGDILDARMTAPSRQSASRCSKNLRAALKGRAGPCCGSCWCVHGQPRSTATRVGCRCWVKCRGGPGFSSITCPGWDSVAGRPEARIVASLVQGKPAPYQFRRDRHFCPQ